MFFNAFCFLGKQDGRMDALTHQRNVTYAIDLHIKRDEIFLLRHVFFCHQAKATDSFAFSPPPSRSLVDFSDDEKQIIMMLLTYENQHVRH